MKLLHWKFLLSVEEDFQRLSRYVEVHPDNFRTYSIELARLLLSLGSEVDVVAKMLIASFNPTVRSENIDQHRTNIVARFPKFSTIEIQVPKHDLLLQPWSSWSTGTNPTWWTSYNLVKHKRHQHYSDASLENALNAGAGLYSLLLYLYQQEFFRAELEPFSSFFDYENSPGLLKVNPGAKLPDFP